MKYSVPKEKYKKINKDIKKGHEKISGDTVPCEAMSPLFFYIFSCFLYFSFGATGATNYQKGRSLDSSGAASKLAGAAG